MTTKTKYEEAPKTLSAYSEIQLTNQQFNQLMQSCQTIKQPSKAILDAAKHLDKEGF